MRSVAAVAWWLLLTQGMERGTRSNSHGTRECSHVTPAECDEILETVASLRKDVVTMSSNIREVLKENAELKEELGKLRGGRRSGEHWLSEAQRIRAEVDQLLQMHTAAGGGRSQGRRRAPQPVDTGRGESPAWLKKMMMFMMLSEMV